MSNNIEFKSKALKVFNYKDVDISSFAVHFEPDMEQVDEELLALRKNHAEIIEVEEILIGDIVALSCRSENKRFNKKSITINVGKGLFSREFENNLPGMKKAEEKEFVINGDKVWVHIDKISRNVIPELTDENLIKWNFEGLKSVKELRELFIDKQHEEFINECGSNAAEYIEKKVAEKSTFDMDEGEYIRAGQEAIKVMEDVLKLQDQYVETMTNEQYEETLKSSEVDYMAGVKKIFQDSLKTAIIGNMLMKEDLHLLTIEHYEMEVKNKAEYKGIDIEEEKQSYTIENHMKECCGNYFFNTVEAYAINYMKEKEI